MRRRMNNFDKWGGHGFAVQQTFDVEVNVL